MVYGVPKFVIDEDSYPSNIERIRELTERLDKKESAYMEKAHVLQRLMDVIPGLVVIADQRVFRFVSHAWTDALGWSVEELKRIPWIELVHPEDRPSTECSLNDMNISDKIVTKFENRYRCRNGRYKKLQWNASTWTDDGLSYCLVIDLGYEDEG